MDAKYLNIDEYDLERPDNECAGVQEPDPCPGIQEHSPYPGIQEPAPSVHAHQAHLFHLQEIYTFHERIKDKIRFLCLIKGSGLYRISL